MSLLRELELFRIFSEVFVVVAFGLLLLVVFDSSMSRK
jgi:preprotein translocase subunit SecE